MLRRFIIGLTLALLMSLRANNALRISSIEVPPAVANNSQVTLVCRYELQGAQLYSVKWYKNFVEFYRFLPSAAAALNEANTSATDNQLQQQQQQQQVRPELALDGINLNLSKSNATHVHLQQTSLASEATYKCEVSADAPSFATVALERPMKVYVLPRQKPIIVDNSNNGLTTAESSHLAQVSSGQSSSSQPSKLNSQRLYNVNDSINLTCIASASRPVAKLTWLINGQPLVESSKWLSRANQHTFTNGLSELRQTLAFRLQPNHLLRNSVAQQRSLETLNVTCLTRLSVEFSSATTIHVPGGKSSAAMQQRRRNQQQNGQTTVSPLPLPLPESLASALDDITTMGSPATGILPPFRWPRPPAERFRVGANGRRTGDPTDTWPPSLDSSGETNVDIEWARRTGRRGAKVYTNGQQQDQIEQIEWLLKLSRPNELEQPFVEARSRLDEPEDPLETSGYGTDWTTGLGESVVSEGEATSPAFDGDQSDQANHDYELNEQVEFSCNERGLNTINLPNFRYSRLRWLINDKEVNQNKVNAFDGNRFYYKEYRRSDMIRTTHLPVVMSHRLPPQNAALNPSNYASTDNNQFSDIPVQVAPPLPLSGNSSIDSDNDTSTLLVEFSATLLSLKELSLKCLTIVEQPLIELASDPLIVSSSATAKFIEVDPAQHRQRGLVSRKQQSRGRHNNSRQPSNSSAASSSTLQSNPLLLLSCSLLIISLVDLTTRRH